MHDLIKKKILYLFPDLFSAKMILAVSGGADSMAMLHFFRTENACIHVGHINYGLRGNESEEEEEQIKKYCLQHDISFSILDARLLLKGVDGAGLQEKARNVRYKWLEQIRIEKGANYILTAHHSQDNAETLLMHLIRGAGLHGLSGIPHRNRRVLRPFLLVNKGEIQQYVTKYNIPYSQDSSNENKDYFRNKIRHSLLPLLEKENPGFSRHLHHTALIMQGYMEWFEDFFKKKKSQLLENKKDYYNLKIPSGLSYPQQLCFFYEMLHDFGFSSYQITQITQSSIIPEGQEFESEKFYLKITPSGIYLHKKKEIFSDSFMVNTPEGPWPDFIGFSAIHSGEPAVFHKERAYFPLEKLKFPLKFRTWRHGDYFFPLGMKGKKKVSDFLKDQGIKGKRKREVWILEDAEKNILWVVPFRTNEAFRVEPHHRYVLELFVKKPLN